MTTQKKENRGGAREGAGRKKEPKEYSEEFKDMMLKGLAKKAKETKKTLGDVAAELMYNSKVQDTTKAGILKIYGEIFTVKESKKTVTTEEKKSVVALPEVQKKPKEIEDKEKEFNRQNAALLRGNA